MFDTNKFAFIRCETESEMLPALEKALTKLETLNAYSDLEKGDRIIHVHETCVASGAGTPGLRWVPIVTVTETKITRVNSKTYNFEHVAGYRTSHSGKYIKDYECGREQQLPDGWRNNQRVYIIRENAHMKNIRDYDRLVCTAVKNNPLGFIDILNSAANKEDTNIALLLREAACVIANLMEQLEIPEKRYVYAVMVTPEAQIGKVSGEAYKTLDEAQSFIESRSGAPKKLSDFKYRDENYTEYEIYEVKIV